MNLENFERVKAAILANPETLDMQTWGNNASYSPCGTVGCMAGFCDWLMAVDGHKNTLFVASGELTTRFIDDEESVVINNAKQFLGITESQADSLFYTWNWPRDFRGEYADAEDYSIEVASVVVRRIDHFLATGE
jgi:hypothetical protein